MALSYLGLRLVPLYELAPGASTAAALLVPNGLGAGLVAPPLIRYVLSGIAQEMADQRDGAIGCRDDQ